MKADDPSTLSPPDRSDHIPGARRHDRYFPEIDIGGTDGRFHDGRPMRVEAWFDLECDAACRTWFYPTQGIEDWAEDDHARYLQRQGVHTSGSPDTYLDVSTFEDASGAELWRVTVCIWAGELSD